MRSEGIMLTKMLIRNFKRFDEVTIELGDPVVFIGPNNSGKTTALQALALWFVGIRRWQEKRAGKSAPEKRTGVTINRRDLITVPVPNANLLWRNLHTRKKQDMDPKKTQNVRIDIIVEGITDGKEWKCGLEFDFANVESFYCRPLLINQENRMPVPDDAGKINIAFLPPMSGLAAQESRLDTGAINVRIGEGRTAEVLRNLCYQIVNAPQDQNIPPELQPWNKILKNIESLFGAKLHNPEYIPERGEIEMSYSEMGSDVTLDLSAAGRGLHQTLLLLAYLYINPGAVLLLDEPDAHLEILRQRQIYQLLVDTARDQGCQIIVASHSEVILNEAAEKDTLVAFIGSTPHRINDRGIQARKALKEIGFEQYYLAESKGWILYLEGSTDLSILKTFAETLGHPASAVLESPFVNYVCNHPSKVSTNFFGLKDAKPDLVGIALFDRLDTSPQSNPEKGLTMLMWKRREIENYLCYPEVLERYARGEGDPDLFSFDNQRIMNECIQDLVAPIALKDRNDRWWSDVKASDDFLDRLFEVYFKKLNLPNVMQKNNYHQLARLVPIDMIDPEVKEKLDAIVTVAKKVHEI
jgi:ABC-type taurine transport system ATPase subunit